MRQPEIITNEILDLDKILLSTKELLFQFPNDNILRLNIEQTEFRKNLLISELQESLQYYGRHSIKFIFQEIKEKIQLESLIENLNSFKTLIDKTFEKITLGKSNNLPIYFNTVFSSSYGIQLSTPFEEKLIDHDFEKALDKVISTIQDLTAADGDTLKTTLEKDFEGDIKLLNRYSLFFKKIHQTDKKIKIIWSSPISKKDKEIEITPDKAVSLHNIFNQQEISEEIIELYGILKGISLIRFRVEFVKDAEGKEIIIAKFDENLSDEVKSALDKYIIAKFKVKSEYNEMTDKVQKKYELISIHNKDNNKTAANNA